MAGHAPEGAFADDLDAALSAAEQQHRAGDGAAPGASKAAYATSPPRGEALRRELELQDLGVTGLLSSGGAPVGRLWYHDPRTLTKAFITFVAVFLVAFGIGFSAGGLEAAAVEAAAPPAPPPAAPPAPWFDLPPAPERPSWLGTSRPGFAEDRVLRLPTTQNFVSTPLWDSLTFDPFYRLTWLALDADGISFVDTKATVFQQMRWLPGIRANHLALAPDGQGWVSSVADAAAILIDTWLSPGTELRRVPLGVGARAGVFDGTSGSAAFALTNGSVAVLASPSGARRGTLQLRPGNAPGNAHGLQSPRVDGAGFLYIAMPYDNKVAKIDLRPNPPVLVTLWDTRPCKYPTGMDIDLRNRRLFLGCADKDAPMLAVLDLADGFMVAQVPIGRGNGAVVYDAASRRVYACNGVAGNVAVVAQRPQDADEYALLEAATTYVGASRCALDAATGTLWTASAQGSYDPTRPANPDSSGVPFFPNVFFPNSIKLVSLQATNG